jgi:hypothetical protein
MDIASLLVIRYGALVACLYFRVCGSAHAPIVYRFKNDLIWSQTSVVRDRQIAVTRFGDGDCWKENVTTSSFVLWLYEFIAPAEDSL